MTAHRITDDKLRALIGKDLANTDSRDIAQITRMSAVEAYSEDDMAYFAGLRDGDVLRRELDADYQDYKPTYGPPPKAGLFWVFLVAALVGIALAAWFAGWVS